MTEAACIVYDKIADVSIEAPADPQRKNALVVATLVAEDGSHLHCRLTLRAALALHAMISAKLGFLVSDNPS